MIHAEGISLSLIPLQSKKEFVFLCLKNDAFYPGLKKWKLFCLTLGGAQNFIFVLFVYPIEDYPFQGIDSATDYPHLCIWILRNWETGIDKKSYRIICPPLADFGPSIKIAGITLRNLPQQVIS